MFGACPVAAEKQAQLLKAPYQARGRMERQAELLPELQAELAKARQSFTTEVKWPDQKVP